MSNWQDIKGYEGLYQINKFGEVKSLDRLARCGKSGMSMYKGKLLKPGKGNHGYYVVSLGKESKFKSHLVHRLVAEQFIQRPSPLHKEVNHIDLTKDNNQVNNLEWVTPSQNVKHWWSKRK